jgi:hypothetical protein
MAFLTNARNNVFLPFENISESSHTALAVRPRRAAEMHKAFAQGQNGSI